LRDISGYAESAGGVFDIGNHVIDVMLLAQRFNQVSGACRPGLPQISEMTE